MENYVVRGPRHRGNQRWRKKQVNQKDKTDKNWRSDRVDPIVNKCTKKSDQNGVKKNNHDVKKKKQFMKKKLKIMERGFTKEEQTSFWRFINHVTQIGCSPTIAYVLITISFEYSRADLDFYERIYHYLSQFIVKRYSKPIDQSRINRIISLGHREFNEFIYSMNSRNFSIIINNYKPYPDFSKIFLRYPSGFIPAMLMDSKTYPGWGN